MLLHSYRDDAHMVQTGIIRVQNFSVARFRVLIFCVTMYEKESTRVQTRRYY
jgi:hypothetical protein